MPMITCPDCKNEMSDAAPSCPKCGKPNTKTVTESKSVGLLLGLGIFFIPLIFSWFTLRKGHTTKAKVISFLWLAVSIAIIGAQDGTKSNKTTSISSTTQSTSASPVKAKKQEQITQVGIREILSAYKNNEVGADNRYKGKLVQVTGIVDDIKKDLFDNLYVTLGTGAQFEIPQIQAFFDDSMNNQLAQLNKGGQLTVVCRVDGLMMNVLAKDCIIK